MSEYLLTGGNGVLGTELQKLLNSYNIDYRAPDRSRLNVTCEDSVKSCIGFFPKQVIHCAAYTDVPGAETNKEECIDTNINGTKYVTKHFSNKYCRVVYISTDYVYPGIHGDYKEDDLTKPVNFYAFTKLAGEAYLDPSRDLIVRTSFKPCGKWQYARAFNDIYTSADYVDVIAKYIYFLFTTGATGIFNVGTEKKTVYNLAKERTPSVEPMSKDDIKTVYLPSDVSMNLDKFYDYSKKKLFSNGGQQNV